jgi:hypothetical protein
MNEPLRHLSRVALRRLHRAGTRSGEAAWTGVIDQRGRNSMIENGLSIDQKMNGGLYHVWILHRAFH